MKPSIKASLKSAVGQTKRSERTETGNPMVEFPIAKRMLWGGGCQFKTKAGVCLKDFTVPLLKALLHFMDS